MLVVECCFLDDLDDIKLYDAKSMAKAIVEGLFDVKIDEGINKIKKNCVFYSNSVDKTIAEVFAWTKEECVVMDITNFKSYTAENLFVS